jgi:hypothetical protein
MFLYGLTKQSQGGRIHSPSVGVKKPGIYVIWKLNNTKIEGLGNANPP